MRKCVECQKSSIDTLSHYLNYFSFDVEIIIFKILKISDKSFSNSLQSGYDF
jgi:hypothetical protein